VVDDTVRWQVLAYASGTGYPLADEYGRLATMRVAVINYPGQPLRRGPGQHGSAAIIHWQLARRLAARHEVTVYAPGAPGQLPEERDEGFLIRRIASNWPRLHKAVGLAHALTPTAPPYLMSPIMGREYFAAMLAPLRADRPDVVHLPALAQYGRLLRAALPGAKIVLHVHDVAFLVLPQSWERRLADFDSIVTVAEHITRGMRERFPALAGRIRTIGNGVDLDLFRPDAVLPEEGGGDRILYVGRRSPEKGVHVLVDAFDQVAGRRPDVLLSLVGAGGLLPFDWVRIFMNDGPMARIGAFYGRGPIGRLRRQLLGGRHGFDKELLARLSPGAAGRVGFESEILHEDLVKVYNGAAIAVMPSLCHEGFGLPVAEAMACGLPVIVSRSGALPDLVEDGRSGLVVERGDVDGLARAIETLLDDPDRRAAMGRAARGRAEALFGWDDVVQRLDAVYRSGPRAGATAGAARGSSDGLGRSPVRAAPRGATDGPKRRADGTGRA
jgi:glycosyltransferase involved in cell wall biosynthesis